MKRCSRPSSAASRAILCIARLNAAQHAGGPVRNGEATAAYPVDRISTSIVEAGERLPDPRRLCRLRGSGQNWRSIRPSRPAEEALCRPERAVLLLCRNEKLPRALRSWSLDQISVKPRHGRLCAGSLPPPSTLPICALCPACHGVSIARLGVETSIGWCRRGYRRFQY